MDIRDKRDIAARLPQPSLYFRDMGYVLQAGDRYPYHLRAGLRERKTLLYSRFDIVRMRVAHRLDDDRIAAAYNDSAFAATYFNGD